MAQKPLVSLIILNTRLCGDATQSTADKGNHPRIRHNLECEVRKQPVPFNRALSPRASFYYICVKARHAIVIFTRAVKCNMKNIKHKNKIYISLPSDWL